MSEIVHTMVTETITEGGGNQPVHAPYLASCVAATARRANIWELRAIERYRMVQAHRREIARVMRERDAYMAEYGEDDHVNHMGQYVCYLLGQLDAVMDMHESDIESDPGDERAVTCVMWPWGDLDDPDAVDCVPGLDGYL